MERWVERGEVIDLRFIECMCIIYIDFFWEFIEGYKFVGIFRV